MNHLVFLDAQAGELEKILSGVKTMLVKEPGPAPIPVHPGDNLFFLRNTDESTLRVKATVVAVLYVTDDMNGGLLQTLKEMQWKLQLTEEQFNHWSAMKQALMIAFESAQKISAIKIEAKKTKDRSGWLTFEELNVETGSFWW